MIRKAILIQGKNRGVDDVQSRRGDIIQVFPFEQWQANDWTACRPPNFYWLLVELPDDKGDALDAFVGTDFQDNIVQVPDIQVVKIFAYKQDGTPILGPDLQHLEVNHHIDNGTKPENQPIIVRKSAWHLLVDNIPQAAKDLIASRPRGYLSIGTSPQADYTWSQIKTYIRRKLDDAKAGDL